MNNLEVNTIHNESNLVTMAKMPDCFIDLTVTSPPYDGLRDYNGYSFDFENVAKELYRVTKDGGVVVWIVNDSTINGSETLTSFKQAIYFNEVGFNVHDTMIWRRRTLPQNSTRYEPAFEYMFVFSKGKPKTFNPIKKKALYEESRKKKTYHRNGKDGVHTENELTRHETVVIDNVWDIPNRGNDKLAHKHPAIFPEDLAKKHIFSWSNKGDVIYDPFAGSGTTIKMAHLQNRDWIASEISLEYIKLANKRLKPYLTQTTLF